MPSDQPPAGSAAWSEVVVEKNRWWEIGERPELDGPVTRRVTGFQAEGARTQTPWVCRGRWAALARGVAPYPGALHRQHQSK